MKTCILVAGTLALAASEASAYDPASVWNWKVRPTVGARYILRAYTRTETDTTVQAEGQAAAPPLSSVSHNRSTADYEILSRDAQNATTIRLTYRAFESTNVPKGSAASTPAAKRALREANAAQSKLLSDAFVGSSLTFKVAPNGAVWSVIGLDKLRARMEKSLSALLGGKAAAAQVASMNFLSDDTFKKSLAQNLGSLPAHPVATGDAWPYAISLPFSTFKIDVRGQRQLLSRRNGLATVKESGTLSILDGALPKTPDGAPATLDLSGTLTGGTIVDEASGLMRESSSTTVANATIAAPSSVVALKMRVVARTVMEPAPGF